MGPNNSACNYGKVTDNVGMRRKDRVIDFLNIPSFQIEVERVNNMNLREKPIVVAPLKSDVAKIWDVSSEAQEHGITKGMELAVAKRLYRKLEVVDPNPDLYESVHKKLLFKASRYTPLYEGNGLGRIFLDFTGFENLYGNPVDFANSLSNDLTNDFCLPIRLGISNNKLLSKAATDFDFVHEKIFQVNESSLPCFLDPFPNDTLPVIKDFQKLNQNPLFNLFDDLNLQKVSDLKGLDLVTLNAIFPNIAKSVYEMSRGIDYRPVQAPQGEPSLAVDLHLDETNNQTILLQYIYSLADKVFALLRAKGQSSSEFKLAVRYSDFKYFEKKVNLKLPVKYSHEVYADLKKAFEFMFSRRVSVRYLMLELTNLGVEQIQLGLFEDDNKKLFSALDEINKKFPDKLSLGKILR